MIENILLIVHLVMAVALVVLVLLQQGKGAQAGAAFGGGGSSQSLFGARGSANFLTRTTAVIATIFFVTTLSLAYLYANRSANSSVVSGSVVEQIKEEVPESDVPMVPADAPADPADEQSGVPAVTE
jgi:preprotein translocase subunit SecG